MKTVAKFTVLIGMLLASVACTKEYDIIVVGGGASGVSAGIQAGRMGMKTLIAEETTWLGGMLTSAGVSATDGNYNMRSGLFGEFTDSLAAYYGGYNNLNTGWVSSILFEPHVGDRIFKNMAAKIDGLEVEYNTSCIACEQIADGWKVVLRNADGVEKKLKTKILIDGTELGDIAAMCGVKYRVGMDAKADTGEDIAAEEANGIVQDLTMVAILKDYGPDADMTIQKPDGYRPELYYNSAIGPKNIDVTVNPETKAVVKNATGQILWTPDMMLKYGKLPVLPAADGKYTGAKYMINWPGDGNDFYANMIEMTPEERLAAVDSAKKVTLGYIYYMQTEYGFKNLGLADDEYPTEDKLPFYPYHRESRRIDGEVMFKVDDAARPFDRPEPLYRTGIAVGNYPVDHHHYRNPDWTADKEIHFYSIPSYSLPLGVIIPKDIDNLLVIEKSISVSNIINGTTRLQPIVMQIGQAAGVLASLAISGNKGDVRKTGVREVQKILLENGGYIMPYLDLKPDDPNFKVLQRIGATGIMRGEGKSVGWSNETWFRANDPVEPSEIFLEDYFPGKSPEELGLPKYDPQKPVSRLEYAVMIDSLLHPFEKFEIDITGKPIANR